jgi:hypothetical protein
MHFYLIASTVLLFVLGVLWERKTWLNFTLKLMFFGLSFFGAFVTLQTLGYIVKG